MSRRLERELREVAEWYTAHKADAMDIVNRLKFLEKTIDFLIWTQAKAAEDIQSLEGRLPGNGRLSANPYIVGVPNSLRTATGI